MCNYIVDFYCHALKYVIEVDGQIHGEPMNDLEDKNKDSTLEENGIYVQRFTNDEVINDIESVMEQIQVTIAFLREKRISGNER
jgi:very-short-patch-repair endonuclease